jgi:solute:Na+ symporter, SSS family
MQPLDWILVVASLLLVLGIGVYTRRYMRSVADFMAAGRCARRYLLAVGRGEMGAGAVVFVGAFESFYHSGLAYYWWTWLPAPIFALMAMFGFVNYRYRETRVFTLGQFFEIRYSRTFRLFAGFLGFFAGLLNFGIIPGIGARVMVYFLDLPPDLHVLGWTVPTYIVLMAAFLSINLFVVLNGGLITIIMTNCVEGILTQVLYIVIIIGLISMFSWHDIIETLNNRPAGQSYLNPVDAFGVKDFNFWQVMMGIIGGIYGTMAWQNQSGYNAAPINAHEGVMGNLLGQWRTLGQVAVITLLCLCAMTFLNHPTYAAQAAPAHAELAQITNAWTHERLEVPIAVTHFLPTGLRGALCVILLLGIFGGDSTHLHSWGSLFIQDVALPLRRKPFTPEQHIRLLRWAITGVAAFAFCFGILFPLTDYIQMWWWVTQGIFIGGGGAVIIGGLYWKKGTTAGAWTALLTGFILSLLGITAQEMYGPAFPLNGLQIFFFTMLVAVAGYVGVSLATCQKEFDLDRMLHREPGAKKETTSFSWGGLIGYDENFSAGDKWIAGSLFTWMMLFFVIAVGGSIWNLIQPWSLTTWSDFWYVCGVVLPIAVTLITGIWFTWGGIIDTTDFFRRLRREKANPRDSGFVEAHQNLDEIPPTHSPASVE